ncbi:MAG: hypothetical protein C0475_04750 [Planctomyces sp.]|nr:hypothetical protein [Planctomyces sp.]MBA4120431.1 hypothetical protein [Isosphaera sp.]
MSESTLQGSTFDLAALADAAARAEVLEKAFDYRGDCALTLTDGSVVAGYIFDRRPAQNGQEASVRLLPPTSDERVSVGFSRIARIEFGKDTAHGKSFETWIKKYVEKKLSGQRASIESESLD